MATKSKNRKIRRNGVLPQFTIRFLLALSLAVCVMLAWMIHCQQIAKREAITTRALRERSGWTIIRYDYQVDELGEVILTNDDPSQSIWTRLFGEHVFNRVCSIKHKQSGITRMSYALANLTSLRSLKYESCRQLVDIDVLQYLSGLQKLEFVSCDKLEKIEAIRNLTDLKILKFQGCEKLLTIDKRVFSSLKNLREFQCRSRLATSYTDLLDIKTSLEGIDQLHDLEKLDLENCSLIGNPSPLQSFPKLRSLRLSFCDWVDEETIRDLDCLQELELLRCEFLSSLAPLKTAKQLKTFEISGSPKLIQLSGISNCTSLEKLIIGKCDQIADLRPLKNLKRVSSLDLSNCKSIRSLSGMQEMTGLKHIRIDQCDSLTTLEDLSGLSKLQVINFINCKNLSDVSSLCSMPQLKTIMIHGCPNLSDEQIAQLVDKLPNTTIWSD